MRRIYWPMGFARALNEKTNDRFRLRLFRDPSIVVSPLLIILFLFTCV